MFTKSAEAAIRSFEEQAVIPKVTGTPIPWADIEIGMLTTRGMVLAFDRRYTVDGAVLVTVGGHAPTIVYDNEFVIVYGRAVA